MKVIADIKAHPTAKDSIQHLGNSIEQVKFHSIM